MYIYNIIYKGYKVRTLIFCLFFASVTIYTPVHPATDFFVSIGKSLEQARCQTKVTDKIVLYTKVIFAVLTFYEQNPLRSTTQAFQVLNSIKLDLKILKQNSRLAVVEDGYIRDTLHTLEEVYEKINTQRKQRCLLIGTFVFVCALPILAWGVYRLNS